MAAKPKTEAASIPLEARVWLLEQIIIANPKPYPCPSGAWKCSRCNKELALGMTCEAEDCPHAVKQ